MGGGRGKRGNRGGGNNPPPARVDLILPDGDCPVFRDRYGPSRVAVSIVKTGLSPLLRKY